MMRTVWLIALIPALASAAEQSTPLGRLFFSPEQRVELDALRAKKVAASQTKEEPLPEVVRYSGIVRRTDGKTTVWVNSKVLSDQELREQQTLAGRVERDGRVTLRTQATGAVSAAVRLKVGQHAELTSGRVDENYNAPPQALALPAGNRPGPDSENAAENGQGTKAGVKPPPVPGRDDLKEIAGKFAPIDLEAAARLRALAGAGQGAAKK